MFSRIDIQALKRYLTLIRRIDQTVLAPIQSDILAFHGITSLILCKQGTEHHTCLSRSTQNIMNELMFCESTTLIVFYHFSAIAASILPKPYQPTALQIPQSVTPSLYRTTLLANKVTTIIRSIRK